MDAKRRSLVLVLFLIMAFSSIMSVYPACAQTSSSVNVARFIVLASSEGANIHAIGLLIFARDISYNPVNTFTGSVYFTSNVGTVSPTASGPFSKGFWRGTVNVAVGTPAIMGHTNPITIFVNDGNGHTGSTLVSITSYDNLPSPTITMPTPTSSPTPLPSSSPTPSTTLTPPSPSIPEFPWTVPLLFTVMVTAAGLLVYHKRKTKTA